MLPICIITRGAPYKTQQHIRQVMDTMYNDSPAGQCGNADCGQMAAWYVFSALGFYPMNPDSGVYTIGSPAISEAVLHLDHNIYHGRTFTVLAKNNAPQNIYVQSATLNGKSLTAPGSGMRKLSPAALSAWSWDRNQIWSGAARCRTARPPPCRRIFTTHRCLMQLRRRWSF